MTEAVRVRVLGRVQAVGFRYAAVAEARRLGVAGWVRNLGDGGVEVHAQGPATEMAEFVGWLRVGPPSAEVEDLEISTTDVDSTLETFEVSF